MFNLYHASQQGKVQLDTFIFQSLGKEKCMSNQTPIPEALCTVRRISNRFNKEPKV